ncbi:MAG TPA: Gfo/Idh/MocA family oxidoreductase [Myxococcaceae bacterium]|nr:Gfo/Idh/MocA family oxidoreductase [Myxococcaceae bacterium]
MTTKRLGIIMHGVTGRMGANQHLARSIVPLRDGGGVLLRDGTRAIPDPILVGRSADKVERLAREHGISRWTTDLDAALSNADDAVFFDAASTQLRPSVVRAAIRRGKHVYCEKPVATTLGEALDLWRQAQRAGVKNGVVQDKLWLPGLRKLKALIDRGFFGQILSVRGEFGYWVFDGHRQPAQRPSWNYRKEDGGGIILDMLCHWRYVLDNLFGEVQRVTCLGATHLPERWDEQGRRYAATADDAAYATFELKGGVIAHLNSSWAVRVRRDDLLTFQVDGSDGSAVAGLQKCFAQAADATPRPVWNPDIPQEIRFFETWKEIGAEESHDNAFKAQWELFIRHVCGDEPFRWTLFEGAKGLQLVECALRSWSERRWIDVPPLEV